MLIKNSHLSSTNKEIGSTIFFVFTSVFCSILIILFNIAVYKFAAFEIKKKSIHRYKEILNNSTQRWLEVETLIDFHLVNALKLTEQYLLYNKNEYEMKDLRAIRDDINVSNIVVFNKEGKMEYVTHGALTEGSKLYTIYRDFSLFAPNMCPEYKTMQGVNKKSTPVSMVFTYNQERQIPVKYSLMWSTGLQRYIQVSYENEEIQNIIHKIINLYAGLEYAGIYTPNGTAIIENISKIDLNVGKKYDKYIEQILIEEDDQYTHLTKSFGGINNSKRACIEINKNLGSINKEYFYVAHFAFNKKETSRSILLAKMMISIMTLFAVVLINILFLKEILAIHKNKAI